MKTTKFKNSEIGPIPEEWEVKRLGEAWSSFRTGPFGSALHAQDYVCNGIPLVNPMHIVNGSIVPSAEMGVDSVTADRLAAYKLSVNDIVIGRRGEMGRAAIVHDKEMGWLCGTGCFYFHLKEMVSPEFVVRYLRTPACVSVLEGEAVGTTLVNLNQTILGRVNIPVPPRAEQEKIAEALSDVDELLAAMTALIEKKRAIKQGAMQELLEVRSEECGVRNVPRRRLAGFTGAWVEKRLGDVADFMTDTVPTQTIDTTWYIGTENMLANKMGVAPNNTNVPYQNVRGYHIGDILTSNIRPYLKKIWLADRNGGCSTDVLVIRSKDLNACIPEFLKMVLSHDAFFDFAMANAVGTKMPRGDKKVLVNYEFYMPVIAEQQAIAGVLSDMDAEIAAMEAKRAKYEQIKQGMMQELLTGKTRLEA